MGSNPSLVLSLCFSFLSFSLSSSLLSLLSPLFLLLFVPSPSLIFLLLLPFPSQLTSNRLFDDDEDHGGQAEVSMMSGFSAESSFIGERKDPQADVQPHYDGTNDGDDDGDDEVANNFKVLLHQQSTLQGGTDAAAAAAAEKNKHHSSLMDDMESMIMSKHEELLMLGVL